MTLTPAYGRDYTSAAAARADFDAGKDFILNEYGHRYDGKPINKEQIPQGTNVKIRYAQLRKAVGFKVPAPVGGAS